MAKVAVVLAGCGVYDGAEINEAVLTLLSLDQQGAAYQCFAPDITQHHVINHLSGEQMAGESRNVLVEAARIARGNIKPLTELQVDAFDALLVPGGFGAAKNLSDFAVAGVGMQVQQDFLRTAQAFHRAGKPIGLMCIAPVMAPAICGRGVRCTIGNDADTAAAIVAMGAEHVECPVAEARIDAEHKLVTTPAYMLAENPAQAFSGISACVREVLQLVA